MFGIKYLFLSAYINEHPKKNEPSIFKYMKNRLFKKGEAPSDR